MSGHCKICEEWKSENILTDCCYKKICQDCFLNYCRVLIKDGKCEIPCPIYKCQVDMKYNDICRLLGESHLISALDQNIVKMASLCTFLCPACNNGKCEDQGGKCLRCYDCGETYCSDCREPKHQYNSDCPWYEIDDGDVKRCPRCNIGIEKTSGCDAIRCSQCKCKFCWNCKMLFKHMTSIEEHGETCSDFTRFHDGEESDYESTD